jgi:O-succinylbenzoic acid--CoA ligase
MPLCHVSGFMAWMRSALSDGSFFPLHWKDVECGRLPTGIPPGCCLSLVPTQLQRLLASREAVAWLRRFRVISLGGAPAWESILKEAADQGLRLAPSYGATETAAMATSLLPEEFLNGRRGCGRALPHAQVGVGVGGEVRVSGPSIFRGYYPAMRGEREWLSGDIGTMESGGFLSILGRNDDLIITGGEKVSPSEVEATLRSSGEFADLAVIGLPDAEWGQEVVALYPGDLAPPDPAKVNAALAGLASFKRPKRLAGVSPWPRNAQGKLDRAELRRLAEKV